MTPLPSSEIWHRGDFPLLCEWRRLTRIVEVGVDRGDFAATFLHRIINCELYLAVDAYEQYPEMPWSREGDFQAACIKLERHSHCAKLARGRSVDIARSITDGLQNGMSDLYRRPYDFVYIDGGHTKADVIADIEAWWPLLSEKGILAGHDWSMQSGDHSEVAAAVMEFAEAAGHQIYYTTDDPSSFYIYKHGMPGPDWTRNPLPA